MFVLKPVVLQMVGWLWFGQGADKASYLATHPKPLLEPAVAGRNGSDLTLDSTIIETQPKAAYYR